jgi:hypothetical protein
MTGVALNSVLQALLVVGCALTAGKLFLSGLYKQYPFFFAYLTFRVPNSLWPLVLDVRSSTYMYFYVCTLPIVLLFYILTVRELYRLVLRDYPGLQTVGRWAMYVSLLGAVVISILTLLPKITPSMPQRSKNLGFVFGAERGVDTALAVFIVLLLAFLSRYPIRLSRNVRVHAVIYSVFFLLGVAGLLARSFFGIKDFATWNLVNVVLNLGCISAWLVLLSPAGETVRDAKPGTQPENEKRLLLQLEGLNAALLRVSRSRLG